MPSIDLNLIVIHYHLNRGGVTSVIRNHLRSILDDITGKVVILHGPGTDGWSDPLLDGHSRVSRVEIDCLGYRSNDNSEANIYQDIQRVLEESGCRRENSLLHIHNHNLGKNNFLLPSIERFASDGFRILLQIHDFAEDLRPDNFRAIADFCAKQKSSIDEWVYPDRPNVHYAFLNHRDLSLASDHVVHSSKTHYLPNPVFLEPGETPATRQHEIRDELGVPDNTTFVIYPVRAIRRKNIAEALLFSAAYPETTLGITLPAKSKAEIGSYVQLKELAERLSLSVLFELGTREVPFEELMDAADFFFSSSITEGFGMTFLESWLWKKQLIGRNLDGVTRDFVESGLDLSNLYEEVRIPIGWIDVEKEKQVQQSLFDAVVRQYGIVESQPITWKMESENGWIDFAKLALSTQMALVEMVAGDESTRQNLLELNPRFSIPKSDISLVECNQQIVKSNFMSTAFVSRYALILGLMNEPTSIEDSVANTDSFSKTEGSSHLIKEFLDPNHFHPIRVEV